MIPKLNTANHDTSSDAEKKAACWITIVLMSICKKRNTNKNKKQTDGADVMVFFYLKRVYIY